VLNKLNISYFLFVVEEKLILLFFIWLIWFNRLEIHWLGMLNWVIIEESVCRNSMIRLSWKRLEILRVIRWCWKAIGVFLWKRKMANCFNIHVEIVGRNILRDLAGKRRYFISNNFSRISTLFHYSMLIYILFWIVLRFLRDLVCLATVICRLISTNTSRVIVLS